MQETAMKLPRLSFLLLLSLLACQGQAVPSFPDDSDPFAGAQWIAMEPDSTILFPHVHLPDARVFTVPAGNYAYSAGAAS